MKVVERIARGYPFKKVAEPLIARSGVTEELRSADPTGSHVSVTSEQLVEAEELGLTLAAGLALGIF